MLFLSLHIFHLTSVFRLLLCLGVDLAQAGIHKALVGIVVLVEIVDQLLAVLRLRIVRQPLCHYRLQLLTAHQLAHTYGEHRHEVRVPVVFAPHVHRTGVQSRLLRTQVKCRQILRV